MFNRWWQYWLANAVLVVALYYLGQLWLADREGRRYSSELRFVAYDSMTEDHPPRDGTGS